jgi:AcrR family transcriptional regulator
MRNRAIVVEAALRLFAEHGADVAPTTIAREAGVGVGTLYRHFPTREALVRAAYRSDLQRLCDAVPQLLRDNTGAGALRIWLDRCVDHAITKSGLADALRVVMVSGVDPSADSRGMLTEAIDSLLDAGTKDGTLRSDLSADDVLVGVTGDSLATAQYGNRT